MSPLMPVIPALVLFLFSPPRHSQPVSLPDAPSAQLQPQLSSSTPTTVTPPAPPPPWLKVEQLLPGTPIAVLEPGRRYPMPCHMDLADDTTLTCIQNIPSLPPRRLVFPIGNVSAVFTEELRFGPEPTGIILGMALGAFLGGSICHEGSASTILSCIALGAGVGLGAVLESPSPLPPRPHIRRRLIYSAP